MYTQERQRIEIIVRKDAGGGSEGAKVRDADTPISSGGDESGSSLMAKLTGSSSKMRQQRVIKTNATHALAISKQVVDLGIEYYIGGIGMRSGDTALQENVSRNMEIFKDATNMISSVSMGALYGAWGGPIGAVLGAVFGAVSTGASLTTKYMGRQREFDFKVFKEENAIEYQRARAGINMTTGRLR